MAPAKQKSSGLKWLQRLGSSKSNGSGPLPEALQTVNFAPQAKFREGTKKPPPRPEDFHVNPQLEAHVSQLAMLENYAAHGMYIKFTDEEASALEREALDVALAASAADAGQAAGLTDESAASATYSSGDVDRHDLWVLASLRTNSDPLFAEVAGGSQTSSSQNGDARTAAGGGPKQSNFSTFRQKLRTVGRDSNGGGPNGGVRRAASSGSQGYSPGSHDHYAGEAAAAGYEYSNGYIFPAEPTLGTILLD